MKPIFLLTVLGLCIAMFVGVVVMIKEAKADSLVCQDHGKTIIYTETSMENVELDVPGAVPVNFVSIGTDWSVVKLYPDNYKLRIGSIIPCVMIDDYVDKTVYLEKYLQIINPK